MSSCFEEELIQLDGKVPIKNLHMVRDLKVFNNEEIFIVFDSAIHIHSISKISHSLPSLICVLDLVEIANKIDKSNYQDSLTQKITNSNRSNFGEIIFSQDLNPDKNVLVSVTHFRQRLRFLGNQFLKVRSLNIHILGHLLVTFQDKRCIFLSRINPKSINNSLKLYKNQQPLLINTLLESLVRQCIFTPSIDINIVCLHTLQKDQNITLSKVLMSQKNGSQVFNISGKKPVIHEKGILEMDYVNNKNGSGWVLLMYYNRLEVIQLSKNNTKLKTFTILSHKQAEFKDQLGSEHVIRTYRYDFQSNEHVKMVKIYLLTSASIQQLQLNFKYESKDYQCWNYALRKKEGVQSIKSNIYFVNFKGNYLQSTLNKENHPNFLLNLAAETDNGIIIRLQANTNNYKEGYLFMACPSSTYIVEKMLKTLKEKQHGDRQWVNFQDLGEIKTNQSLRKQILKEIQGIYKDKKQQTKFKCQNYEQSQLISVLIINVLSILQGKKDSVQKFTNLALKSHLKLEATQNFARNRCFMSNKAITVEDILLCPRCLLYCIKGQASSSCCYICWNLLLNVE